MRVMGLRAERDTVHWALVSGTLSAPVLMAHDRLLAPEDLTERDYLAWFRAKVYALLENVRPDSVAIHLADLEVVAESKLSPKALSAIVKRARIEGVLLEACRPRQARTPPIPTAPAVNGRNSPPSRKHFTSSDGSPVDWREISSTSRRQAILAAAALLEKSAAVVKSV